jgi:HK97 gp10 family phage protein
MSFTLRSRIPQLTGDLRKRASALVRKTALDVERRAKILAPVDTGTLQRSIQTAFDSDLSAVVFVGASYGIHLEFGTRRMSPRPFLGPAFEETAPEFAAGLKELLKA